MAEEIKSSKGYKKAYSSLTKENILVRSMYDDLSLINFANSNLVSAADGLHKRGIFSKFSISVIPWKYSLTYLRPS